MLIKETVRLSHVSVSSEAREDVLVATLTHYLGALLDEATRGFQLEQIEFIFDYELSVTYMGNLYPERIGERAVEGQIFNTLRNWTGETGKVVIYRSIFPGLAPKIVTKAFCEYLGVQTKAQQAAANEAAKSAKKTTASKKK